MSAKVDALALKNRMELFGPEVGEYIFRLESKVSALESALARERKSRKQAEDKAFNAGIEAALNVIAYYRDTRDQDYSASMVDAYYAAKCIHERVVHLKKPIPQEPAERERGK